MEVPPLDIWEGHQLIASDSPIGNVLAKLKELVVWECGQWMNISLLNRTSSGVRPKGLAGCQISADPTGASFLNYWWDLRISATLCFWVVFSPESHYLAANGRGHTWLSGSGVSSARGCNAFLYELWYAATVSTAAISFDWWVRDLLTP